MVSIFKKITSIIEDKFYPPKRPLELGQLATDAGVTSDHPAVKRRRVDSMSATNHQSPWAASISSYFTDMFHIPKQCELRSGRSMEEITVDDDDQPVVVGGVEAMRHAPPTGSALRHTNYSAPRNTSFSSLRSMSNRTPQRVLLGGSDGLLDTEHEEEDDYLVEDMDGDNGCNSTVGCILNSSAATREFQFQPTVASTVERRQISRSDVSKWRAGSSQRAQFGPNMKTYGRVNRREAQRTDLAANRRFGAAGLGVCSAFSSSKLAGVLRNRKSTLTGRYSNKAKESYKIWEKEAYSALLRENLPGTARDPSVYQRESSIASTSTFSQSATSVASSAAVNKSVLGPDWARRRANDMQMKASQKNGDDSSAENCDDAVALWTEDDNRTSHPNGNKSISYTTKNDNFMNILRYSSSARAFDVDCTTSSTNKNDNKKKVSSASSNKENMKNKNRNDEITIEDDDDIEITKETVHKAKRLSSLEQQESFEAFFRLGQPWIDQVMARCDARQQELARQRRESELTVALCSERRKNAPTAEDAVTRRMQLLDMRHPAPRIEISDEEEDALVELTPEMEKVINDAFRKSPPNEMLIENFNIQITRRDIATLSGLHWLNDEVVNYYMNLLMERSKNNDKNYPTVYAFNTFFYPKLMKMGYSGVKRWTKKVDVFAYDLILVPVHLGMHWCLATISNNDKTIRYYDSMLGENNQCLSELLNYLSAEHTDKKKSPLDRNEWRSVALKDIPQQMNGSDCGMFACKFSEYLSRGKDITFTQDHMPYFRRRMVYEIVSNKLL